MSRRTAGRARVRIGHLGRFRRHKNRLLEQWIARLFTPRLHLLAQRIQHPGMRRIARHIVRLVRVVEQVVEFPSAAVVDELVLVIDP